MAERLNAGEVCTRIVGFAEGSMGIAQAAHPTREHCGGSRVVVDQPAIERPSRVGDIARAAAGPGPSRNARGRRCMKPVDGHRSTCGRSWPR